MLKLLRCILFGVVLSLLATTVSATDTEYKVDFDYANQGDDWYGRPGLKQPHLDFPDETDITTQQGDDFCLGFNAAYVGFKQGPELTRTQTARTAYAYNYIGGTGCLFNQAEPPFDLIFADGFE